MPANPDALEPGDVGLCLWGGDRFRAEYLSEVNGRYLMKALENTSRFSAGTEISVEKSELQQWL